MAEQNVARRFVQIGVGILVLAGALLLILTGYRQSNSITSTMSVTRYSDTTDIVFEETADGYRGASYRAENIPVEEIRNWLDSCRPNGGYYQYIYADADSWDMFVYYPCDSSVEALSCRFKFSVVDSIVSIWLECGEAGLQEPLPYQLIRIQAPPEGPWPSSSELFVDDVPIDLHQ